MQARRAGIALVVLLLAACGNDFSEQPQPSSDPGSDSGLDIDDVRALEAECAEIGGVDCDVVVGNAMDRAEFYNCSFDEVLEVVRLGLRVTELEDAFEELACVQDGAGG